MALSPKREKHRKYTARKMFDEWAISYDSTIEAEFDENSGIGYEEYMEELLSIFDVPEGGRILDVATGTALVAIAIAQKMRGDCHIIGIDMTPGMIDQAKHNLKRSGMGDVITLEERSAEKLPFDDCSFDLVNCSLAIHHMNVPRALAEMSRVMKPRGQLVVADYLAPPKWETPIGRIGVPVFRFIKRFSTDNKERADIGYAAIYRRRRWNELLSKNGLGMKEFRQYPEEDMQQWAPFPFILVARKED